MDTLSSLPVHSPLPTTATGTNLAFPLQYPPSPASISIHSDWYQPDVALHLVYSSTHTVIFQTFEGLANYVTAISDPKKQVCENKERNCGKKADQSVAAQGRLLE
jgi:hypothetical protein